MTSYVLKERASGKYWGYDREWVDHPKEAEFYATVGDAEEDILPALDALDTNDHVWVEVHKFAD